MMIDVLAQPHRQHSHADSLHTGQYRSTTPAHSHATFALRGRNEDTHETNAASSANTGSRGPGRWPCISAMSCSG